MQFPRVGSSGKLPMLLTECEERSWECWPDVLAVRAERSEVRTKISKGQFYTARLEQLVSSLLYGTRLTVNFEFTGFRKQKIHFRSTVSTWQLKSRPRKNQLKRSDWPQDCLDIYNMQTKMETFQFVSAVEDKLVAQREFRNQFDQFAIKVLLNGEEIVGHLPCEYSRIAWYFLTRGGSIPVNRPASTPRFLF